jgi:hypothetical protein
MEGTGANLALDVDVDGSVRYWGDGVKLIYRHYATLYFVFAVDQQESDLGILDLIQGTLSACLHVCVCVCLDAEN